MGDPYIVLVGKIFAVEEGSWSVISSCSYPYPLILCVLILRGHHNFPGDGQIRQEWEGRLLLEKEGWSKADHPSLWPLVVLLANARSVKETSLIYDLFMEEAANLAGSWRPGRGIISLTHQVSVHAAAMQLGRWWCCTGLPGVSFPS